MKIRVLQVESSFPELFADMLCFPPQCGCLYRMEENIPKVISLSARRG